VPEIQEWVAGGGGGGERHEELLYVQEELEHESYMEPLHWPVDGQYPHDVVTQPFVSDCVTHVAQLWFQGEQSPAATPVINRPKIAKSWDSAMAVVNLTSAPLSCWKLRATARRRPQRRAPNESSCCSMHCDSDSLCEQRTRTGAVATTGILIQLYSR
jgi:hypothetical protein